MGIMAGVYINLIVNNGVHLINYPLFIIRDFIYMPASQLTTSWIRIATEGETVDGRRIEPQWLIDMAETYDPTVYTALLWPEHERWYGNLGEVLELHSESVDGLQRLFAKLCPSPYLISENQRGQLLFTSIEPTETLNFRGTGKPYLEGLGVTNSPASIGTERLRFKSKESGRLYGSLEPLVIHELIKEGTTLPAPKDKSAKNKDGGAFTKLLRVFNIQEEEPEPTPEPDPEDAGSTKEALQALADAIVELGARITALETDKADVEDVEALEVTVIEVKEEVDSAEFKALKANYKTIMGNFSKLDAAITKLPPGVKTTTTTTDFDLV